MNEKYRFDHKTYKHGKRSITLILLTSVFVMAIIAGIFYLIVIKNGNSKTNITGPAKIVGQAESQATAQTFTVNEPDYTLQLPIGWHAISSITGVNNSDIQYSNSWESSGYVGTQLFLSVYVDNIPTTYPVNGLLPLTSYGNRILYGSFSGNCSNFTTGSSITPTPAVWESVDFLCNLPNKTDNQIGTGSTGDPINTVTVTGPTKGTHNYFFLYIDRSAEPDYSILYNIMSSFRAK
jgi:hypothetical protein